MERIALAREYRVAEWLRDAYLELVETKPLDFDQLRPEEPYSTTNPLDRDWEADAKRWKAASRDWEMLARISHLQTKAATAIISYSTSYLGNHCFQCNMDYGAPPYVRLCKCRLLAMVDETFRKELESFKENPEYVEHPLPCKLANIIPFVSAENNNFCIANSTALPKKRKRKAVSRRK